MRPRPTSLNWPITVGYVKFYEVARDPILGLSQVYTLARPVRDALQVVLE